RNIGNAAKQNGGHRLPPEQQSGCEAWGKVHHEIKNTIGYGEFEVRPEFFSRVFKPQHEEKQQDPNLGPYLVEILAQVHRRQASVTEGEAGNEIKRNG